MKTNPKLTEALVNLRGNPHFKTILEGLAEHEQEEINRCVEHEGSNQLRASGAVKAIRWWLEAYQSAPKDFEKFQSQPKGKNTP